MLYEDIVEWIKAQPYWMQNISSIILDNQKLTDQIYNDIYSLFKIENGLCEGELSQQEISFRGKEDEKEIEKTVLWKGVKNVTGINALKNGESMEVNQGLNLVYGENGSGKSGYTRLFNNAFSSKGDKSLLPNVYEEMHDDVYAEFLFCQNENEIELKYPADKDNKIFNCVMVFDTESATKDMRNESELSFVPSEFDFFDRLLNVCEIIEKRLEEEISERGQDNKFLVYFDKPGKIRTLVESLDYKIDISQLKTMAMTEEEINIKKDVIKKKSELVALNIEEKCAKLNRIKEEIENLKTNIEQTQSLFTKEALEDIKELIQKVIDAEILAKSEGLEQFKEYSIMNVGSSEWKAFLVAAQNYYKTIDHKIENCIFCGQKIEGIEIIDKYWKYLGSVAESNLKALEKILLNKKDIYSSLAIVMPDDSTIFGAWLKEKCLDGYTKLSSTLSQIENYKNSIVAVLEQKAWNDDLQELKIPVDFFDIICNVIASEESLLNEVEIRTKIAELETQEQEFIDREKLMGLMPQIEVYINDLKWINAAEKKKIKTRQITSKQKELFTKYVTDDYIAEFKKECSSLNASFDAEIAQRGSKGTTLKKIVIKGNVPGTVLSEGEQRAICIANFLAEVNSNPSNIAIIFDDPVSSLDHNRRRVIAERLVLESKKRQVVVFTHDISFLMEMKTLCDSKGVEYGMQTIRKIHNKSGCISKTIPWQGMSVKERIKKLNNELQNIQRLDNAGEVDKYFYSAKEWCELLRESWERSVEEILLNDAIQRYNPCVQTQRLSKAPFTKSLYDEVERGMTECSAWVHDRARALNGGAPTVEELKRFIGTFSDFVKTNRP